MFSGLGTEGSNGSVFRNVQFQCFPVKELEVPKNPYLEMGGSKDRKSVVQGKSVDLGGRRIIKKKKEIINISSRQSVAEKKGAGCRVLGMRQGS